MKKALLQKTKSRIKKLMRPQKSKPSTAPWLFKPVVFSGLDISHSRQYAGTGPRMRFSRSKYNPIEEDIKHERESK